MNKIKNNLHGMSENLNEFISIKVFIGVNVFYQRECYINY